MKRAIRLARINIKSAFRDPLFIFWDLVFPAILFIVIINLTSIPNPNDIDIHLYVLNNDENLTYVLEELTQRFEGIVLLPSNISDPITHVIRQSLLDPESPILVTIKPGFSEGIKNLNASMDAYIPPPTVDPLAKNEVYIFVGLLLDELNMSYSTVDTPVTIRFIEFSTPPIFQAIKEGSLETMKMFLSIWLMVGALHASGTLIYIKGVKLHKRMWVSPIPKWEICLWLYIESLLMAGLSTIVVWIISMLLGIPLAFTSLELAIITGIYLTLVLFSVSISLMTTRISPRDPLRSHFATLMTVLVLLFVSGYSIPYFLFPETVKRFVVYLPTFHLYSSIETLLIFGYVDDALKMIFYPLVTSLFLFPVSVFISRLGEEDE